MKPASKKPRWEGARTLPRNDDGGVLPISLGRVTFLFIFDPKKKKKKEEEIFQHFTL